LFPICVICEICGCLFCYDRGIESLKLLRLNMTNRMTKINDPQITQLSQI
jgi:hypothetical protein